MTHRALGIRRMGGVIIFGKYDSALGQAYPEGQQEGYCFLVFSQHGFLFNYTLAWWMCKWI